MLLTALLWALPSFLIHNIVHEGAHALVALWSGASDVKLWPFPGRRLGYFTFAHMTYTFRGTSYVRLRWVSIAPVFAEALWLALALLALFIAPVGWWSGFLIVEAVSPIVDCTTWLLGYWNPNRNPSCDAEVFRSDFSFSRLAGKLASLVLPLPAAFAVWGIVRIFSTP